MLTAKDSLKGAGAGWVVRTLILISPTSLQNLLPRGSDFVVRGLVRPCDGGTLGLRKQAQPCPLEASAPG